MKYSLFISAPKGLEYLLEEELTNLGFTITSVNPQGVYLDTDKEGMYKICLYSRIASRVNLILFRGQANGEKDIYNLCLEFPWGQVFTPDKTMAIEFHGTSKQIRNTMFGGQVIKDAIVDKFRQTHNIRPDIDRENPDVRIHAHIKSAKLTVSFDLTGFPMHQRGYRLKAGKAPLKENIAAAMLYRAKWSNLAEKGYILHDPFCGSGTILIEAAMIATSMAPGLIREDQALQNWQEHDLKLWNQLRADAKTKIKKIELVLQGSDISERNIALAKENAISAGVSNFVNFTVQDVVNIKASSSMGIVVTNPPYGERLGEIQELIPLYEKFGRALKQNFQGFEFAFLTSNPMLSKATTMRAPKQYSFYNGQIACKLYCGSITKEDTYKNETSMSKGQEMFANRLQKNFTHLQKWAKRKHIQCYRVYDADLPEYAFAIDIYNNYAVLQEYKAPTNIKTHKAQKRVLDVLQTTPHILAIAPSNIVLKQRQQQKGINQYQKLNKMDKTFVVNEGKALFKINIYDYLDTGLFLDHRLIRQKFATLKAGTKFLNLYCYTGSASVHAALNGAITTNVDLSKTYINWAIDNFKLNKINPKKHDFIQDDCLMWLKNSTSKYDVIFLDPPSFSNSKRTTNTLDIQRDHEKLIDLAASLLAPHGKLYFSTNLRQFKLASSLNLRYTIKNITEQTIDLDFKRNKKIHHCFEVSYE